MILDGVGLQYGAQGRNRTTDTVIFSHVLYQLSYLGPISGGACGVTRRIGQPAEARRSLTFAFLAVHPAKLVRLVGWRAWNPVALAEPFQEVAVLAAAAAEGGVRLS